VAGEEDWIALARNPCILLPLIATTPATRAPRIYAGLTVRATGDALQVVGAIYICLYSSCRRGDGAAFSPTEEQRSTLRPGGARGTGNGEFNAFLMRVAGHYDLESC